jgi:hypothetical protein
MKDALAPTLLQTLEDTPVLVRAACCMHVEGIACMCMQACACMCMHEDTPVLVRAWCTRGGMHACRAAAHSQHSVRLRPCHGHPAGSARTVCRIYA